MHTTILITGATGTVGREVAIQLSMLNDIRVRAGVHSLIKGENLKRLPGVEIVEIDFEDPGSLKAAFTHIDKLFLITPSTKHQVEMSKKLIDEARQQGVKHLVKLSAMGADEPEPIEMARWHAEIERYVEASGIPYTFLRCAAFMQNFANFEGESIKSKGELRQPLGDAKVGYIDVRDIAAAGVAVLTETGHEGKAYNLTGPEALSNHEIAQLLTDATSKPVRYVDVPEEEARQEMLQAHMPDWMVDAMLELDRMYKAGGGEKVTDAIETLTGQPPRSFQEFATDYRDCFV